MNEYGYPNEDAIDRMRRQPKHWANLCMIGINILVFAAVELTGSSMDTDHMLRWGASWFPYIQEGEIYRLLSCMFLHFGLNHLGNNMLLLLFLGDALESLVGKGRYLLVYLGGGVLGNICSCLYEWHSADFYVSAGASGGVFAVMGAMAAILLKEKGQMGELTLRRLGLISLLSIYHGFTASGVDSYAHLGGFVSGFLLGVLVYRRKRSWDYE